MLEEDEFDNLDLNEIIPIKINMKGSYNAIIPIMMSKKTTLRYPHQKIGVLISAWLKDKAAHPETVTRSFIELNLKCTGNGYGSRTVSKCWGMNHYKGKRKSD